ncbi:DsrE family protein [Acidithiobacillus sp.]|jgi:sulfur relay (sulfurtransferase) complex TusBCD TusD component (DsrE family)|uniref:DsrE family protein n=1 Tax=Acidithiobacillus sp. TaxID=1872118 RepID=UPI0025BBE91D|nr:DsrE family protein [Acidithiobacillus sp.]MCK9188621.1 DsrE family protein [Acidithiobacillus sp.]MCK9360537.1 DsrE family protein [Acidithiobacillus sp.]
MHWTILIKSHPDAGGNSVLQGLRMAAAALADDIDVSIFLAEEAASLALHSENLGGRQRVHHDLIAEVQELGAEIHVIGLEWLHLAKNRTLIPGIKVASMKTLVRQMKRSDQVVTL